MLYFLKQHFLLSIILLLTVHANGQFTQSKTCIGGSGNDILYPRYINTDQHNYSFKTNDGGSIYFGSSNSTNGTFAPNKGYNDLVAVKIAPNGTLGFTKNLGNYFYEQNFIVTQNTDSSKFFILLENYSNDSFYTNDYEGNITIQYSLICIEQDGNVLWNKILRTENYNKVDKNYFPDPHFENQINLFIDQYENNLTFFEHVKFDTIVHRYIIDSIFYSKTDASGNIKWISAISPFSIYNNSSADIQIDTFFNYSFRLDNNFASVNGKYFQSAFLSNNRNYTTALYSLDDENGAISDVKIIDSFYFKMCSLKNSLLVYGDKSIDNEDNGNKYSSLLYRKYDINLNVIYENQITYYDDVIATNHYISNSATPYFNVDSSKIWFDTHVTITDFIYYSYMLIGINSKVYTYSNIVNQQSGTPLLQLNLNKKEFNYLSNVIDNKFYYASTNLSTDSVPSSIISVYNFNGVQIHEKKIDSTTFSLNSSVTHNVFCNIPSSLAIIYSDNSDSIVKFFVLDTLCNTIMSSYFDSFQYFLPFSNLHVIDTNHYCVLQSIWQDTISGCYPNTDNIVFSAFYKNDVISSVKHHTTSDFLTIYPNPNNGNFTIDFSSKGNFPITISLFDVTGKIVYQQTVLHNDKSLISINEEVLASGLYNIQISSANDVWNKKVLITK